MLKKTIIIFVVLSFISVSISASIYTNTGDPGKEKIVLKEIVPLSDREMEMSNGLGLWDCVEAAGLWTAGVIIGGKE